MPLAFTPQEIDVVILCGGLGTRLRSVIHDRPKVMAEIHGRPFLDILINYVAKFGFARFVLCVGYKSEVIKEYYERKRTNLKIVFSEESKPLGTAGALKKAERLIHSDVFLVFNGDSLCEVDIKEFIRFHERKNALISIVLTPIENPAEYGVITLDEHKKITHFSEKVTAKGALLVNAGIYCMNKPVLGDIPLGRKSSLEYDVFPKILKKGIYGYRTNKRLIDIGTPERLEVTKQFIAK